MTNRLALLNEAERLTDGPLDPEWHRTASEALVWRARQDVRFMRNRYSNRMAAIADHAKRAGKHGVAAARPCEESLGEIQEILDGAHADGRRLEHAFERLERLERGQP